MRYGRWSPEDVERALETVRNSDVGQMQRPVSTQFQKLYFKMLLDGKYYEYIVPQVQSVSENSRTDFVSLLFYT
jgi:hypothetical protein